MLLKKFLLLFVALCFLSGPAYAFISPEEQAKEAYVEEQAGALFKQLRCLVCDNQSIESSDSDMAKQLRDRIRDMLEKGNHPQDVLLYVHQNYGDEILYNPPLSPKTIFLWTFPFLFLVGGFLVIRKFYKS